MDAADEQFLLQFASINPSPPVTLPDSTVHTRDWNMCSLAAVITDRNVIEANFEKMMIRGWGINPETEKSMITKNTFLIQFVQENDLLYVLHRGPWNYRDAPIATRQAYGPADLESPVVKHIAMTTQWHRLPTEAVKKEAVALLAPRLGTPLSEVTETCIAGNRCFKIKILMPIDKSLKDRLEVTHSTLRNLTALIVYERINKVCMFCAKLGHDQEHCVDNVRVQSLKLDPRFKDRSDIQGIQSNRVGPWINNLNLVPHKVSSSDKSGNDIGAQSTPTSQAHENTAETEIPVNQAPKNSVLDRRPKGIQIG